LKHDLARKEKRAFGVNLLTPQRLRRGEFKVLHKVFGGYHVKRLRYMSFNMGGLVVARSPL